VSSAGRARGDFRLAFPWRGLRFRSPAICPLSGGERQTSRIRHLLRVFGDSTFVGPQDVRSADQLDGQDAGDVAGDFRLPTTYQLPTSIAVSWERSSLVTKLRGRLRTNQLQFRQVGRTDAEGEESIVRLLGGRGDGWVGAGVSRPQVHRANTFEKTSPIKNGEAAESYTLGQDSTRHPLRANCAEHTLWHTLLQVAQSPLDSSQNFACFHGF
jgi:hypothetical protein